MHLITLQLNFCSYLKISTYYFQSKNFFVDFFLGSYVDRKSNSLCRYPVKKNQDAVRADISVNGLDER